jgi:diguanylate cyclase (GGDEF)-like protein/PAS domain S-box-containing protein
MTTATDRHPGNAPKRRVELIVALTAIAVLAALLTWLFLKADPGDQHTHQEYESALRLARRGDAELNAAVLANRLGLQTSFDPITTNVRIQTQLSRRLVVLPPDLSEPNRAALSASTEQYRVLQARKAELVDLFKRSHSVLRNSLAYFPVTLEAYTGQFSHGPESEMVESFALLVLNQSHVPDPAIAARAGQLGARLRRLVPQLPPERAAPIDTLVRHGLVILKYKPEVDALSRAILELPTAATSEAMTQSYARIVAEANERAHRFRILLYLLAIALACYLAAAMLRLSRTSGALRRANTSLKDRIRTEAQTAAELRLYASVFTNASEGMIITDSESRIAAINPAFTSITGYAIGDVIGHTPAILASGVHDRSFYTRMWEQLSTTGQWAGEIWNRRKDESVYAEWLSISAVGDDPSNPDHYIGIFSDVTDRKEAEARIQHLAHHDALTGLPNRLLMNDRINQAIHRARRHGEKFALLFIDLDRFKLINDTLGHEVGDALLVQVAERCHQVVRESDTVSRQGGDEFVVLLAGLTTAQDARHIAQKLTKALSRPYLLDNHELAVTASLGIAMYPGDGESASALMRNADAAMYRAKSEGRNRFEFYSSELETASLGMLLMENQLRGALSRKELKLFYQPKVDARTGECASLEALLRWEHPELGLVLPNRFITTAEETGLIAPIGAWVIGEACRQLREWIDAGLDAPRIAVNLSAHQFASQDVEAVVSSALRTHGIPPDLLELELTETMLMRNPKRTAELLRRLRSIGLTMSIDDFGTGYSSLGYLHMFPVQELKIDASFVHDIQPNGGRGKIAKAIIALAHELGLRVVAEGVETSYQHEFLSAHGCDQLQGYRFSRPVPADEITTFFGPSQVLDHWPTGTAHHPAPTRRSAG